MEIRSEHFVDASEQRPDGFYDYYYAYTVVSFCERDTEFIFRIYDDTPTEANFLCIVENGMRTGVKLQRPEGPAFRQLPKGHPLLKEAIAHLEKHMGVKAVTVYDGQRGIYTPLGIEELKSGARCHPP